MVVIEWKCDLTPTKHNKNYFKTDKLDNDSFINKSKCQDQFKGSFLKFLIKFNKSL